MARGDNFKGQRPEGAGRRPGSPNKNTKALKDMILGALSDVGGQAYLARQAEENPGPFLTLIGKVLPITLATDPNNVPVIEIRRVIIDERPDE
jgi:hypothetical protein